MISSAAAQQQLADHGPKVDVSMESKLYGYPKENDGDLLWDSSSSQNMYLKWTFISRATCKGFRRKMHQKLAEHGHRVYLNMESII